MSKHTGSVLTLVNIDFTVDSREALSAGADVAIDLIEAVTIVLTGVAGALIDILCAGGSRPTSGTCTGEAIHKVSALSSVAAWAT